MKIKIIKVLFLLVAALLWACGESTTEQVVGERDAAVSTVAELPACEKSNEGEQVLVKGEKTVRVCAEGKWYSTIDDVLYVQGDAFICTAEKIADGMGMKILCNGDSVGVVYNGKNGADGKKGADGAVGEQGIQGEKGDDGSSGVQGAKGDDGDQGASGVAGNNGTGCSVNRLDEYSIRVKCGKDSTILYTEGDIDSWGSVEPVILDSEKVAISLDNVSGVSQKGPFLSGSKVRAYEISDGRSLKQTGNAFNGKITSDNGEFKINARTIVSQYLILEANGFYRNEVTGKNSDAELTLFAITDVSDRNVANINLLTHLEYERVQYLVTQKKMKVRDAKKQAQKEVFNLLHIDAEGFGNSEDLNISGYSEGDGALLAFSTLLQGDRSVAGLSELLAKIAADMEEDGVWDDTATKILIADWAADADSLGLLSTIRDNVFNWSHVTVPNFAKYVLHFRDVEYGLGDCTSDSVGIVKSVATGKRKGTKTRYICSNGRWRIASDLEKDTYLWEPGFDGEIKLGSITESQYYLYDSLSAEWRKALPVELELGACTPAVAGDSSKNTGIFEGQWYRCPQRAWVQTEGYELDKRDLKEGTDGEVAKGKYTGNYYVYDAFEGAWRPAREEDYTLGLNGCTTNRTGELAQSPVDGKYYSCIPYHDNTFSEWILSTDKAPYNTAGNVCNENVDGDMMLGLVNTGSYFVCEDGAWREATVDEEILGESCTLAKENTFSKDSTSVCENRDFRKAVFYDFPLEREWTNPDLDYGELVDSRDGRRYKTIRLSVKDLETEETTEIVAMAENLNYVDGSRYLEGNNWCYRHDSTNCLKGGRYYTWTAALYIDAKWQNASVREDLISEPHRGICPEGWHIPSNKEWTLLIYMNSEIGYEISEEIRWQHHAKGNLLWPEATNASGFSALPAGVHSGFDYQDEDNTIFEDVGSEAFFWSSDEQEASQLYGSFAWIGLRYMWLQDNWGGHSKSAGMSVRCFKDNPATP